MYKICLQSSVIFALLYVVWIDSPFPKKKKGCPLKGYYLVAVPVAPLFPPTKSQVMLTGTMCFFSAFCTCVRSIGCKDSL